MPRTLTVGLILAACYTAAACTVDQASQPPLIGPSELATSLSVTATPDTINQDGSSKSTVIIAAHGPSGQAMTGLSVRVDMAVGGVIQDFGSLSARSLVTGPDGRASVTYTAPPAPPPAAAGTINVVSIVASPVSNNAQSVSAAGGSSAEIRLTPLGVILPPSNSPSMPTAAFTVNPGQPTAASTVLFDASTSCGGQMINGACDKSHQVISYAWSFGDGGTGSGRTSSHSYGSAGAYAVTLTVTNELGQSNSATQLLTVGNPAGATGTWIFSPATPNPGDLVSFNADGVQAPAGHSLVKLNWNFGDPTSSSNLASGFAPTHIFATENTYRVTLTVNDDAGQQTVITKDVKIGTGGGGGSGSGGGSGPTASFKWLDPQSPPHPAVVTFDATGSAAASGTVIKQYIWTFTGTGGTTTQSSGVTTSNPYPNAGSFSATLTVVDSNGATSLLTQTIIIQ